MQTIIDTITANYYALGVFVSFAVYTLIGLLVSLRVKNAEDYYVSGRNAPTFLVASSLIGSYFSTVTFMGDAGFAYSGYGIPVIMFYIFILPAYVIGVLFFGRYLRRSAVLTLPEYFAKRFHSQRIRLISALTLILGITAYLVAVTQGAGLLLAEITGMEYNYALILIVIIYTLITFTSGAKGVLITDTLMFTLFFFATLFVIPYFFEAGGGVHEMVAKAKNLLEKPDLFSWHGITGEDAYLGTPGRVLLFVIISGFIWGSVVAVSPWQASRYLMAKNEHVAIRSAIFSVIASAILVLCVTIPVMAINAINAEISPPERVFIWGSMNLAPVFLGMLAISAILAAALSSATTFLQLIGYSLTKDILKIDDSNDKRLLRISRWSMIVVGVLILFITSSRNPAIFWIAMFAATLFAASWGPAAIASTQSSRVTRFGATASILTGFLSIILIELLKLFEIIDLPRNLPSVIIGAVLAILVLIIGSYYTQPSQEEKEYFTFLRTTPAEEFNDTRLKRTLLYPKLLIVSGFIISGLLYYFYYLP